MGISLCLGTTHRKRMPCQPFPVEKLARIDLPSWCDIGMADDIGRRNAITADDLVHQRHKCIHLHVGKRPIAILMARIDDLDPDADRKSTPSELQSLMRISHAVFGLKKQKKDKRTTNYNRT